MSKGSCLFCSLLLLVCIAQLVPLIWSSQIGVDDGDLILRQDPIRRAPLMSSHHGRDELADGHSADSISDDEYGSIDGGLRVAGGVDAGDEEEEEGILHGDSGGTNSTKGSYGSGGGADVECPECGKFFRNDKSMFGHLRSHPNRGYKGAIPPVKKLKLSPDTAAAASSSCSLSGIDRTTDQDGLRDPQLSPIEILCAYVLLTLKYRHSSNTAQEARPSSSFGELDAIGQAEGTGASGGESVAVAHNAAAEFKCDTGAEAGNQLGNCDQHEYPVVKIPKKRRNMPKEVREAHRKKMKFVMPPKEKRPYACKHCKAEFPTNQALGGHVAGHHREKKVPRLIDPSGMAAESLNGKQQQVEGGDDNDKESLRSGLLSKQFSVPWDVSWQSGNNRASGGQMRQQHGRSNDGLSSAAAAATIPALAPTRTDDGDARRQWDIDLNVDAPEHE